MLPSPHTRQILPNPTHIKAAFAKNTVASAVDTDPAIIKASREIVLCCGTFDTPKLLLLSGIGPRHHLPEMSIPLKVELAGVGEHLLDHPEGVIIWEANQPVSDETTQYWEVGLFSKIFPASPAPDVMFHFGLVPFDWNTAPLGYPTARYGFSMTPNVPQAKSEGVVRLRSPDPKDAPRIDFRYFTDPEGYNEAVLLAGMKLARTIANQPPLQRLIT